MNYTVIAYALFNTEFVFEVESRDMAREYAKRIITEGLWKTLDNGEEVFYPVHQIVKVKIKANAY